MSTGMMSEKLNEQISALVDGELPEAEQELLLARLARDPDLKRSWQAYHLIGASLRNQLPDRTDQNLVARVGRALESDPPLSDTGSGSTRMLPGMLKPLAGLAIAASVAVVAVLTVQQLQPAGGNSPIVASAPVTDARGGYARVDEGQGQQRLASQAPDYLNQYLVNHNEYAASSGIRGMLPYVRIVGYDSGH